MCKTCALTDDLDQQAAGQVATVLAAIACIDLQLRARDGGAGDPVSSLRDATHNKALLAVRSACQMEAEAFSPSGRDGRVPEEA